MISDINMFRPSIDRLIYTIMNSSFVIYVDINQLNIYIQFVYHVHIPESMFCAFAEYSIRLPLLM